MLDSISPITSRPGTLISLRVLTVSTRPETKQSPGLRVGTETQSRVGFLTAHLKIAIAQLRRFSNFSKEIFEISASDRHHGSLFFSERANVYMNNPKKSSTLHRLKRRQGFENYLKLLESGIWTDEVPRDEIVQTLGRASYLRWIFVVYLVWSAGSIRSSIQKLASITRMAKNFGVLRRARMAAIPAHLKSLNHI